MQFRTHRFPTQFPLKISTPNGPKMGHVVDVSNGGAQVIGVEGLKRGDKVALDVLSHRVEAVVCWSAKGKSGIAFRRQITDFQVDTLRQRRGARNIGYRGSVGFGYAEMR